VMRPPASRRMQIPAATSLIISFQHYIPQNKGQRILTIPNIRLPTKYQRLPKQHMLSPESHLQGELPIRTQSTRSQTWRRLTSLNSSLHEPSPPSHLFPQSHSPYSQNSQSSYTYSLPAYPSYPSPIHS
jgi:hypothetical protein